MYKNILLFVILTLVTRTVVTAQDDIDIYGYVQASYLFFNNTYQYAPPEGEENYKYNNMGINQLNLFFARDLGTNLSAFINFEFLNNYSSNNGFGSMNLQEAYIKYDYRDYLKIKFGMVIPQFNSMFEIYNRTPLLPYIVRPKLYDATGGNLVDIFDILPQKALVQIYGTIPVQSANIEYALFAGNPPNKFLSSADNDIIPGYVAYGQSSVDFFSYGGRLGLNIADLRVGVSGSWDTDNQSEFEYEDSTYTSQIIDFGNIDRFRFGADVCYRLGDFELTAEYLYVKNSLTQDIKDSLKSFHEMNPYGNGSDLDKLFYFVSLQYNITDEAFIYAMYDFLDDKSDPYYFGLDGYYGYHFGGGYYLNDNVILKAQYTRNLARYDTGEETNPVRNYYESNYAVGVSVSF